MSLEDYGWNSLFAHAFAELEGAGLAPARVVSSAPGICRLVTSEGPLRARLAGRWSSNAPPVAGDWVACAPERALIHHLLPRRTRLSRKAAGRRTDEQVVAANVDVVFVVMGLDGDFNPRRVERFLTTVWESGASPVVVLNKSDVCLEARERLREIEDVSPGASVLVLSALEGIGVESLHAHLPPGRTGVLVGSSGAGKSTLVNRLLGREARPTREVRSGDDRGKHTTTDRELFLLPTGALLIDGPGIRELGLWTGESSLERSFDDLARLGESCRFRDCRHESEPGCAVVEAVARGELDEARLASFHALRRELHHLKVRQDESAARAEKRKWRAIHKEMRKSGKHRRTWLLGPAPRSRGRGALRRRNDRP